MAQLDKGKLEKYRKGELKFMQIFGITGKQWASVITCGYNFYNEGKLEEARKIFEGLSVLDSKAVFIQTILGAIYQRMKQFDTALLRYDLALQIHPEDLYALTNRAEIYLLIGKFLEASMDLKKVLQLDAAKKHPATHRANMLSIIAANALRNLHKKQSA